MRWSAHISSVLGTAPLTVFKVRVRNMQDMRVQGVHDWDSTDIKSFIGSSICSTFSLDALFFMHASSVISACLARTAFFAFTATLLQC